MLSNNKSNSKKRKRKKRKYSNYHQVIIHKGRGHKNRRLNVPNKYLRAVQRKILQCYLYKLTPSEYSTAYKKHSSLIDNAAPHIGKECVLKLDISGFFDSIDFDMVYSVFCQLGMSAQATTLLTNICTYNSILPQGAPTSPHIANLVMKKFDESIGRWCAKRNISYTHYSDDMTFSGKADVIDTSLILKKVGKMLDDRGFSLNHKKTAKINSSQRQQVTGIVVNQKPQISSSQRRSIRQEVYYCRKYGVEQSLLHSGNDTPPQQYIKSLLGRISFALQVNPDDEKMKSYFDIVKDI